MPKQMPLRLQKYLLTKPVQQNKIIYPFYLSILAIFKNEGMNMDVWVRHYLWMGVEHFFLIDNGSDDNSQEILKPYVEKGLVSVFYMPEKWKQTEHYQHVYQHHIRNKSQWVIIADLDEFWYVKESTIRNELPRFEQYNVITSHWRWFGSDGHVEHPADIRTAITHRIKDFHVNTKYIFQSKNIRPNQVWIHDTLGKVNKKIDKSDIFRLNHYPIQSIEFFQKVKMARGSANTSEHENVRTEQYFEAANAGTDHLDTDLKDMIDWFKINGKIRNK